MDSWKCTSSQNRRVTKLMDRKDGKPLKLSFNADEDMHVVNAGEWKKQSPTSLFDQLSMLQERYAFLQQMGKAEIAKQMLQGIEQLQREIAGRPIPKEFTYNN